MLPGRPALIECAAQPLHFRNRTAPPSPRQKRSTLPGNFLLLDKRSRCDGRKRGSHHPPIAENIVLILLLRSIRESPFVEVMHLIIGSNNASAQSRLFDVPRVPSRRYVAPSLRSSLGENLVQEVPGPAHPPIPLKYR